MQGGVCYNQAVPMAMANLCGVEIVVPPDPGLMGAFGAALLSLGSIEEGRVEKGSYDLQELSLRHVEPLEPFMCRGGKERCDRKCTIARYRINGDVYPFGGSCDMYFNHRQDREVARGNLDLVSQREELLSRSEGPGDLTGRSRKIGIPVSLMTNTYYMLYERFFTDLGLTVLKGEEADPEGMEEAGSTLCHPVLQSHGYLRGLLNHDVDHIFVPHVRGLPSGMGNADTGCTCPLVQGEPYILKAAFYSKLSPILVTEVLDLDDAAKAREAFVRIGKKLGFTGRRSTRAFERAWKDFGEAGERLIETGRSFLSDLKRDEAAMVLFGRSYNALTRKGNMGIPGKFASRGYRIIPYDMLPPADPSIISSERMYWASGKGILDAARVVRNTPGLFGVFITNFSCGPDSLQTVSNPGAGCPYSRCRCGHQDRGVPGCSTGCE
jgi:predicted nucleotide-binding protein (sugar kinase/HSP70/actin superfamily)